MRFHCAGLQPDGQCAFCQIGTLNVITLKVVSEKFCENKRIAHMPFRSRRSERRDS